MPRVSTELTSQYWEPDCIGPVAQADLTTVAAAPTTINASSNWTSAVLYADGHKAIAVSATLSQAGSINVQRYLDVAGTVTQGPALTLALTAGTAGTLNILDGAPFQSFTVQIANSGASVANLTKFGLLLNAS